MTAAGLGGAAAALLAGCGSSNRTVGISTPTPIPTPTPSTSPSPTIFDPTNFPGINSFNGQITVTGIPDTYGSGTASDRFSFSASNPGAHGSDFISILTIVNLLNPSPIMLTTNDNALPVYYQGAFVGVAAIANLGLLPAAPYATNNTLPATRVTEGVVSQLQYQPAVGDATAYQLVTQYLYGKLGNYSDGIVPITINTQPTNLVPPSPYDSLVPALRGIKPVNSQFQALGIPGANRGNPSYGQYQTGLVTEIYVILDLVEAFCFSTCGDRTP